MPWNFPLLMAAWKLAPALATGNTAVFKPAETTPLTALLLAEICQEADLPAGVVNIVTGDGSAGAELVRSRPRQGRLHRLDRGRQGDPARAGRPDTGLTLELGGKSANIVFEDAALDQAVEGIVDGIFFNQGHVCCAGSRLLLQESVAEEVDARCGRGWSAAVGDPLDKNTDVGAINSAEQLERIEALVAEGEREGATRCSVGCALPETGYWFPPTLFTDVAPVNRIAVEEIRPGRVRDDVPHAAEAVERANNSAYGLAAGVWTDNGAKAFEVACALRAGIVWQNTYNRFDPTAAFGGYKESGFGREGGPAGLLPVREADVSPRAVAKTYKLYVGGEFARRESGRSDPDAEAASTGQRAARLAQGRARRGQGRARRAGGLGDPTAYNRGQILYRFAEALESRADKLAAAPTAQRPARRPRRARGGGRPAVHYAGWTDKLPPCWAAVNPVAMPYLGVLHARADRRGGGARAGRAGRARAGRREPCRRWPPAAGRRDRVRSAARWRPAPRRGVGVADVPAGGQLSAGWRDELVAQLAGHRDVDGDPRRDGRPELFTRWGGARRGDRQARRPSGPDGARRADGDRAVRRNKDRVAPSGHVAGSRSTSSTLRSARVPRPSRRRRAAVTRGGRALRVVVGQRARQRGELRRREPR